MRKAKFTVGQLIHHRLFGYRGVIVDVDPVYSGTPEWYLVMAQTRPPKDQPWYHVLVHDSDHQTYVAERNLASDSSGQPIRNPKLARFFDRFSNGIYFSSKGLN